MSIAVDTNVIINVIAGTPDASSRAVDALTQHGSKTGLVISPIVFAELFAHPGWTEKEIQHFLKSTAIAVDWELTDETWTRAGQTFRSYANRRTRGHEKPRRILADFLIGAHAVALGGLITSDSSFHRTNFPELRVIDI